MINFLLSILKLILGILVIPVVYGVSTSCIRELKTIDPDIGMFFMSGVFVYLAFHILIFEPKSLFQKGQQFIQSIFGFSKILGKIIAFITPVYALFWLIIYFVTGLFIDVSAFSNLLLILTGFFVALHFIQCAEELKAQQGDLFKSGYISSLLFIWISCIIVSAAIFHTARNGFYFGEFFKNAYDVSLAMYHQVWQRLLTRLR